MPIKIYKPTTQSRRKMSTIVSDEITRKFPEKSLLCPIKKHAGRDRFGHISVRHRGGGAKRMYRIISSLQERLGESAKVISIEYDPNRSARIALVEYTDKKKIYIVAPRDLKVDMEVKADYKTAIKTGNRMQLTNIPTGINVYDVELTPGRGGKIARSAGNYAVIMSQAEGTGKRAKYVQVKMPSGEIRLVHSDCYASIGSVSNYEHDSIRFGKAGRKRHMGIRPSVRGKAMNPNDHPHGGGEGVNPIGLIHPKTPWGKPAMGLRTRKNKSTNKFIVRRRDK
ncbi:MAG: hypothetical protein ACD_58C00239G0008 [uncultured bacterium]|nr:MAG: hypothetical protein ACD_58C00239G0008 [uncultured bacterium]